MSTKGAKAAITDEEKLTFNPLFIKYIQNELSSKDILKAVKGDKKVFARFKSYSEGLTAIINQRQDKSKIAELEKAKVLLTNRIQQREDTIKQSRSAALEVVLKNKKQLRI